MYRKLSVSNIHRLCFRNGLVIYCIRVSEYINEVDESSMFIY